VDFPEIRIAPQSVDFPGALHPKSVDFPQLCHCTYCTFRKIHARKAKKPKKNAGF